MKSIFSIILVSIITITAWAQSPEKISYQAVIRNAENNLVINQQVGMQISILQGSVNGSSVYTEVQAPTTNANGLVSIQIGTGATGDNFSSIDWSTGLYFIKTQTDIEGGINYTITGTSQLLSVPYALHAKTAETVTGEINITETDPEFTFWDKSSGITITESQISNLQSYLTDEVDPQFANWDKTTGIVITESQISDLKSYLTSESDPTFTAWNKSTGVTITEAQITDLQSYLTAEVDPAFSAWDKATGIVITESQISDLKSYLTSEADPVFIAWDKDYADLTNTPTTITTAQADAITANTAKNSYPSVDATKLSDIATGAEVNVQADWNQTTDSEDDFIKNKPSLSTVATSGDYNDLSNKPTTDGSETALQEGTGVSVTGSGTSEAPYVISSTITSMPKYSIGDSYKGGIVVYVDDTGYHGLIAKKCATYFSNISLSLDPYGSGDAIGSGLSNSILHSGGIFKTALTYTTESNGIKYGGWYVPSLYELQYAYDNKALLGVPDNSFVSSTKVSNKSTCYCLDFSTGQTTEPITIESGVVLIVMQQF